MRTPPHTSWNYCLLLLQWEQRPQPENSKPVPPVRTCSHIGFVRRLLARRKSGWRKGAVQQIHAQRETMRGWAEPEDGPGKEQTDMRTVEKKRKGTDKSCPLCHVCCYCNAPDHTASNCPWERKPGNLEASEKCTWLGPAPDVSSCESISEVHLTSSLLVRRERNEDCCCRVFGGDKSESKHRTVHHFKVDESYDAWMLTARVVTQWTCSCVHNHAEPIHAHCNQDCLSPFL